MDASVMFKSLVAIESGRPTQTTTPPQEGSPPEKQSPDGSPTVPARTLSRTSSTGICSSEPVELHPMQPTSSSPDPNTPGVAPPSPPGSSHGTAATAPPSPLPAAEILPSAWTPPNRARLAAVSLINLGNGLNDSAPGALIPYVEAHFGIGYAVVSLVFVGTALGFVTGAFVLDALRSRLGRGGVLLLAQSLVGLAYIPLVFFPGTPFAVVVVAFFLVGLGVALNISVANTFAGSLRQGTLALGILHGSYGVGGTVGPLVATALVTSSGADLGTGKNVGVWGRYYAVPLGLAVANAVFAWCSFRGYEAELEGSEHQPAAPSPPATTEMGRQQKRTGSVAAMTNALGSRVVLLGALFIFAYQGAEVSISGWVISFLMSARGGDPASVGYVTSGFWAGITVGRLLLSGPGSHRFGERAFVYGLVAGSAVFEALVWAVPNVVGDAVAVAGVGLLLGPVYPCAAAVLMRCMGRAERLSGMGVISAFGSSGGAAAPFTTGLLAQVAGTFVLHPIVIGLFGVMVVCWWALPKERKRTE